MAQAGIACPHTRAHAHMDDGCNWLNCSKVKAAQLKLINCDNLWNAEWENPLPVTRSPIRCGMYSNGCGNKLQPVVQQRPLLQQQQSVQLNAKSEMSMRIRSVALPMPGIRPNNEAQKMPDWLTSLTSHGSALPIPASHSFSVSFTLSLWLCSPALFGV